MARPRQKDIPIPARPRAHTPLGEAVSPTEDPIMIETPEEVLQIRLQYPSDFAAGDSLIEGRQGMMSAELWPATK